MTSYPKHPHVAVDYQIDWGSRLGGRGVSDAGWTIEPHEPGGLALDGATVAGGATRVTLSGGRPGGRYRVTGAVCFTDGARAARSIDLQVGAAR
jgi:hypothetical protein